MEELIENICEYVKKPYTDYAVMINGEWGSGKTYFWNNKLRKRLESIKVNGKNYKTIYMSLYGINSLNEISKKIFIETNPTFIKNLKKFSNTREGNSIPEYAKTGLDMANFFGNSNMNLDRIDYSKLFSVEDKILCFDDLERANVDVIDILGYINNFVEHDGIKTILICNERELATKYKNKNIELKTMIASYMLEKKHITKSNEIPLSTIIEAEIDEIFKKSNDYERIKEKLIGETFEYVPEYAYILSGMILKYSYYEELSDFLKKNTAIIISVFKKSNTRNLRILKHALNDFEKIFENIKIKYQDIPQEILRTILNFTLAVSFEIKSGSESKENLKEICNNEEYMSILYTSSLLNDTTKFYLSEFDKKYFMNQSSKYKFFKFVEVFIRTRYFDDKLFQDNMNQAIASLKNEKIEHDKKYLKVMSGEYLKLSDMEFNCLLPQVVKEIQEGNVYFYDYVRLYSVFFYFLRLNLIDYDEKTLKGMFQDGMKLAIQNDIEELVENNKGKMESNLSSVISLQRYQNKLIKEKLKILIEKKAKQVFSYLPDNITLFYQEMITKYKEVPIFANIEAEVMYQKLKQIPNYDLNNMIKLIEIRYEEDNNLIKQEKENLLSLSDLIEKDLVEKKKGISTILFDTLSHKIKEIFE